MADDEDGRSKAPAGPGVAPGSQQGDVSASGAQPPSEPLPPSEDQPQAEPARENLAEAPPAEGPERPVEDVGTAAAPESPAGSEPRLEAQAEPEPPRRSAPIPTTLPTLEHVASPRIRPRPRILLYAALIAIGAIVALALGVAMRFLGVEPPATTGGDERIHAVIARTDSIERKHESSEAAWKAALSALESRVGTVESTASKAPPPPAEDAPFGDMGSATSPDLGGLVARLDAIEQRLEAHRAALAAAGSKSSETRPREDDTAAATIHAQAIAIITARLRQELEQGKPFADEVTALARLGVDEAELATLRGFADTGVASMRKLAEQFAAATPAILAAEPGPSDASLLDRVTKYATDLVRIERLDEAAGKDVHRLVSRITTALAHDNVVDAYALWNELPGGAKAKSESFGEAAKARLDGVNAARSIEAAAVASLSKPKS